MSDQPGRESIEDDLTTYSVDDEDQLQPEDTLDGSVDPLDRGYQVPDRFQGVTAWGITADEQRQDETIDQRIRQERPDPDSAYGAPDNESGMDRREPMVGGDDPDAIPAEQDFVGGEGQPAFGGADSQQDLDGDPDAGVGSLVAPDAGGGEDAEPEALAQEEQAVGAGSPEEAAMHLDNDDPQAPGD